MRPLETDTPESCIDCPVVPLNDARSLFAELAGPETLPEPPELQSALVGVTFPVEPMCKQ
jgi:hypothetical protein